ncbi:TraR/DksA family transcriptional regulator [Ferruginibacter yonginensis]|uniref:TraR/DksA family transcriptional regulator n=1 Tax=Ferruginibacter yonginensis TaxID=1310416 RepID=A0ABV8QU31_9BACT
MATKKAPAKSAVKKPAPKKNTATPVKKAAPAKKAAAPVKKAAAKPVAKKAAPKPVAKKAAAKPVAVKKAAKPVAKAVTKTPASSVKKSAPAPVKKAAAPQKPTKVLAKTPNKPVAKAAPVKAAPAKVAPAKPVAKAAEKPAPAKVAAEKPAPAKVAAEKPVAKAAPAKPAVQKPVVLPKINTKTSRKYEPDFTKSVLDKAPQDPGAPIVMYSDADLAEFKELIQRKLASAKKELAYLQGLITRKDDMGGDEGDGRYMTMEDGSLSMERENLSLMASRQITFVDHLEKALIRIENKTYGVCRVTGKLIDKARLRAVPHATLSMEAKMSGSK